MSFNQLLGLDVKRANQEAMLDDLGVIAKKATEALSDDLDEKALTHAIYDMRAKALAVVLVLANDILDDDLDTNETPAERLDALVSYYIDDEEDIVAAAFYANMQDAMVSLGVPESIAEEALYADDEQLRDEAVETLVDLVNSNVPDDDDFDAWQNEFIYGGPDEHFGDEGEAEQLDGLTVGKTTVKQSKRGTAIYKAEKAVRNGEVVTINKRVAGKIRLSAKQRASIKKAARLPRSSKAVAKRQKSLKVGKRRGMYD